MADLTLTELAGKLPAGTLTEGADDVTVSLKALTGEASVQLADEVLAEVVTKLLSGAAAAQVDHNAVDGAETIGSYPQPNFGNPVANEDGSFSARRTHTIAVAIPLDVDEAVAV